MSADINLNQCLSGYNIIFIQISNIMQNITSLENLTSNIHHQKDDNLKTLLEIFDKRKNLQSLKSDENNGETAAFLKDNLNKNLSENLNQNLDENLNTKVKFDPLNSLLNNKILKI